MTTPTHTPGPWRLENHSGYRFLFKINSGAKGHPLGVTFQPIAGLSDRENEANARLIASAPDMLDALQAIVDAFGDQDSILIDQCKAALNKATGKQ